MLGAQRVTCGRARRRWWGKACHSLKGADVPLPGDRKHLRDLLENPLPPPRVVGLRLRIRIVPSKEPCFGLGPALENTGMSRTQLRREARGSAGGWEPRGSSVMAVVSWSPLRKHPFSTCRGLAGRGRQTRGFSHAAAGAVANGRRASAPARLRGRT